MIEPNNQTRRPRLLILSMVHRNALATALGREGWQVIASRRFDDAAVRLGEVDVAGVIVDLRDDASSGLSAIQVLAGQASVLAIVPGRDVRLISAAIDAGASCYLTTPFPPAELAQAARLIGGARPMIEATRPPPTILDGDAANEAIERRLSSGPVSALLIAATRFGTVNAAFGRGVGDELLGVVAQRIAAAVREADPAAFVARVSGAEFAVLVDPALGVALAHEIVARLDRPFMAGGHIVAIGCRIGVVESMGGEEPAATMRRASAALAEARASDGSPVRAVLASDRDGALFDASLEADLRRALDDDEIDLVFQPQVSIASGRIVGVEALARWRHPVHGELGAVTLFAVAARSDYLATLSAHVQRRALELAQAWPAVLSALRLSINLTAADVALPGFVESFLAMVDTTGFPRARLTIEVTESGLMDDLETASAVLAALRSQGCRVAIDDFGTGYSSLAYLKALPLDYLKIDKQLAQDIDGTARDRIVVRGIIDMARSLGLAVVAEGVETEAQMALLAAAGCNYIQGYLFAEPLSVDELADFVAVVSA